MLETVITPAESLAAVTWSSSNEAVAVVDSKGKVTGVSAGTATITCTAGGVSASCNIEVQNFNEPQSLVITNAEKAAEMAVDDTFGLETEITPRYADKKKVFWKSSDLSVVTVDELGTVVARGVGQAQIMGYVYNSKYTDFETLPEGGDPLTAVIDVKVGEEVTKVEFVDAP
jgi:lactocepin